MPISSLLRFQDYQFQVSLASGAWKWTTRVDISGTQVATQIRDVISPFGLLRDSIPIPGEIAQAMAESIDQVVNTYAPSILLSPVALTVTVDEGRGVSAPVPVQITNNGILGSLLSLQVTSSAPFLLASPATIAGLVANASGAFDVSVDSTGLVATASPYEAHLTVQGSSATNSPQTFPVTVSVRPKATISAAVVALQFNVSASLNGMFSPVPSQQFALSNSGLPASVLAYQIRRLGSVSWLAGVSPAHGLINGGATQPITVLISPPRGMLPGTYTETLRVSGYSTNLAQDILVTLNIV